MTRDPEFFKKLYLKHIPGQINKYWFPFSIKIGTVKKTCQVQFQSYSPTVLYQQHDQKGFF